jgi:hypothetical protein
MMVFIASELQAAEPVLKLLVTILIQFFIYPGVPVALLREKQVFLQEYIITLQEQE